MIFGTTLLVIYFCLAQGKSNDTVIRQTRPTFDNQTSNKTLNATVEIETTSDAQNNVIVEIINNHILALRIQGPLMINKNIYAYIRFNSLLHRYTIKGTGNTMTDDNGISNDNNDTFILDNRGVANVAMRLNVNEFEVYFTGTGNSRFWGQVRQKAMYDTKGVGDIHALNLETKQVKVQAMGISTIRVSAADDMQIEVTGVSSVYYRLPRDKKPSKAISTGLGKIVPIY